MQGGWGCRQGWGYFGPGLHNHDSSFNPPRAHFVGPGDHYSLCSEEETAPEQFNNGLKASSQWAKPGLVSRLVTPVLELRSPGAVRTKDGGWRCARGLLWGALRLNSE